MIKQQNLEQIKDIVKEFFKRMNFQTEIEILPPKDSTLYINLKMTEPQILIGEKGHTLFEIQHLLQIILRKKIEENFYIDIDINDYKKKKIEYLKELALSTADDIVLTKKEKALPPMPAYERRIIHLTLSQRSDVITESIGKDPERRVVIKPHP